jgi:hypothetical protein
LRKVCMLFMLYTHQDVCQGQIEIRIIFTTGKSLQPWHER